MTVTSDKCGPRWGWGCESKGSRLEIRSEEVSGRAIQRSWAVVTELRGVQCGAGETPLGWEASRPRGAVLLSCLAHDPGQMWHWRPMKSSLLYRCCSY